MPIASFADVDPGCSPYTVQFVNTSQNATSYVWDFGDGSSSPDENPEHTFFHGGTYAVRLTAFGPGGMDKYQQLITVYQSPVANLDVAPNFVYVDDKAVKCFNLSSFGDSYFWEFGDGATDTIYEPYHVYSEEGIFDISLTVYTDDGCEDKFTLSPAVTVEPAGVLRYPTAFKPNKTGPTGGEVPSDPNMINTVFFPPIKQQIDDYHLQVFNRWGELLFESTDINIGWDGYFKGQLCKQDVYVWQVVGRFNNGKPYRQAGDITLLH
jgi:gliding motility-associated-like protein